MGERIEPSGWTAIESFVRWRYPDWAGSIAGEPEAADWLDWILRDTAEWLKHGGGPQLNASLKWQYEGHKAEAMKVIDG